MQSIRSCLPPYSSKIPETREYKVRADSEVYVACRARRTHNLCNREELPKFRIECRSKCRTQLRSLTSLSFFPFIININKQERRDGTEVKVPVKLLSVRLKITSQYGIAKKMTTTAQSHSLTIPMSRRT